MQLSKILAILLLSFPAVSQDAFWSIDSQAPFYIEKIDSQGGVFSRIINTTNQHLYCYIGYADFYVQPHSVSRWYNESDDWQCEYL